MIRTIFGGLIFNESGLGYSLLINSSLFEYRESQRGGGHNSKVTALSNTVQQLCGDVVKKHHRNLVSYRFAVLSLPASQLAVHIQRQLASMNLLC